MSAVVVIPWWPGTESAWRYRWRDEIGALWVSRGYEIAMGVGREGAARNNGIDAAVTEHDANVILISDADGFVGAKAAEMAVEMAENAPGLVIPHDRYVYLGESLCEHLTVAEADWTLESHDGRWPRVETAEEGLIQAYGPLSVGGPIAFSVETWRQAGGFDENLIRAYDGAFALACATLVGPPRRLPGDYVHLYHERPDAEPGEVWVAMREYHAAAEKGIKSMADLIRSRGGPWITQ